MQKSTPGDGKPSRFERFRRLILFLTLASLLIYSAVITERLYRVTRSFIHIAKESSAVKAELVVLAKQIVDLKSEQEVHTTCQVHLSVTQKNLEMCLGAKKSNTNITTSTNNNNNNTNNRTPTP